jgi:hypothetical protein
MVTKGSKGAKTRSETPIYIKIKHGIYEGCSGYLSESSGKLENEKHSVRLFRGTTLIKTSVFADDYEVIDSKIAVKA